MPEGESGSLKKREFLDTNLPVKEKGSAYKQNGKELPTAN